MYLSYPEWSLTHIIYACKSTTASKPNTASLCSEALTNQASPVKTAGFDVCVLVKLPVELYSAVLPIVVEIFASVVVAAVVLVGGGLKVIDITGTAVAVKVGLPVVELVGEPVMSVVSWYIDAHLAALYCYTVSFRLISSGDTYIFATPCCPG